MIKKNLAAYVLALLACLAALPSAAHEYAPGMRQWKVKGGNLTLVSSVVTNGMALYAHNYNLYFQRNGDKDWYHIPLLDKEKPGEYELNLTSKAKDERMVRDARLVVGKNEIYLLRARSLREDDFEDAPIVVTKYRFVATEGEDWPYLFRLISSKTHPAKKDVGVDRILQQEAQRLER